MHKSFFIDDERTVGLFVAKSSTSLDGDIVGNSVSPKEFKSNITKPAIADLKLDFTLFPYRSWLARENLSPSPSSSSSDCGWELAIKEEKHYRLDVFALSCAR